MLQADEKGFSMIRMMIWGIILGGSVLYVSTMWPIYSTYWKVEDAFEGAIKHLSTLSPPALRARLPDLLNTQYIRADSLPKEFYDHLEIKSDGKGSMKISSSYHITAWFLGEPDSNQSEIETKGKIGKKWNHLRGQWKKELEFKPHAESSNEPL